MRGWDDEQQLSKRCRSMSCRSPATTHEEYDSDLSAHSEAMVMDMNEKAAALIRRVRQWQCQQFVDLVDALT